MLISEKYPAPFLKLSCSISIFSLGFDDFLKNKKGRHPLLNVGLESNIVIAFWLVSKYETNHF